MEIWRRIVGQQSEDESRKAIEFQSFVTSQKWKASQVLSKHPTLINNPEYSHPILYTKTSGVIEKTKLVCTIRVLDDCLAMSGKHLVDLVFMNLLLCSWRELW